MNNDYRHHVAEYGRRCYMVGAFFGILFMASYVYLYLEITKLASIGNLFQAELEELRENDE